jgi:hypothetical protein
MVNIQFDGDKHYNLFCGTVSNEEKVYNIDIRPTVHVRLAQLFTVVDPA